MSFLLDAEEGTRAELMLMPPGAFATAPSDFDPFDRQLADG